jgi:hypothetical protein
MNADQRKYLVGQIENTYSNQVAELKESMPKKPSLNNYLIAAFLDNSIQFADINELKEKMRQTVLRMGKDDVLVKENNDWRKDSSSRYLQIVPEDLFVIPSNYLEALREYEEKKKAVDEQISALDAHRRTLTMKIQIGSNAVLDKLITQVDNMGDLNIFNSQLMLGGDEPTKQLKG